MKKYFIYLISIFLLFSCKSNEKEILIKSNKLINYQLYEAKNLYFLNDKSSLLAGYQYIIHIDKNPIVVEKIEWDNLLFNNINEIYLLNDELILGYDNKRKLVIGNIQTKKCMYYSNKINIKANIKEKINHIRTLSSDYGHFIEYNNNSILSVMGGISKKSFCIKNNFYYNYIIDFNPETEQKKYLVKNKSKVIFDIVAKNKNTIALIYEYKKEPYIYVTNINDFIKKLDNITE